MEVLANPLTLFKEASWFSSVRSWFKYTFDKNHIALMKEAYKGRPYDHGYLTQLEYAKIKEMVEYHEKRNFFVGVEYVIRDMKICLSLLDIVMGKRSTFHYDGNIVFVPIPEEEMKEKGYEEGTMELKKTPDFRYHCDVYVNTRNVSRFTGKKYEDFYVKHPHELYELKARTLYHKIRAEHEAEWWD